MKGRIMYTAARVNWAVVNDAENHQAVFSVQVCIYREELCTQLLE